MQSIQFTLSRIYAEYTVHGVSTCRVYCSRSQYMQSIPFTESVYSSLSQYMQSIPFTESVYCSLSQYMQSIRFTESHIQSRE